jgi:acetylornithine deacetylase
MSNVVQLLSRLVAIDSVNPTLVPGAAGEAEMAGFVADWLNQAGAEVEFVPAVAGDRPSVLGVIRGTGGSRSLLLYSHLDTVGVLGMHRPHEPVMEGDKFYGRGSLDMKGGMTAVLLTAAACRQPPLAGDLYVAAVADEESGSLGMEAVLRRLKASCIRPDAAIVAEPSQMQLCLAHRGFAWASITTHGRAAHTAMRGEGVDAIARMGRILVRLEQLDQHLQNRPAHPLLEHGSVLASLIRGGSELFTYAAECRIDLIRRTLPGEDAAAVAAELDRMLSELGQEDPQFSATAEVRLHRAPFETSGSSPIAAAIAAAAERRTGRKPAVIGAPFWTDGGLLAEAGISTVIMGPSGEGLHSDLEWVSLSSVETLADILTDTARNYCTLPR